jgi:plasmid stabilization system protein ParE
MNRFVRILTVARADIDQIFDWIGKRSLRGVATWYDALFDSIQRIAENPEGYSTIPEALPRWNRRIHQHFLRHQKEDGIALYLNGPKRQSTSFGFAGQVNRRCEKWF